LVGQGGLGVFCVQQAQILAVAAVIQSVSWWRTQTTDGMFCLFSLLEMILAGTVLGNMSAALHEWKTVF
jgi:hypothetical protein